MALHIDQDGYLSQSADSVATERRLMRWLIAASVCAAGLLSLMVL